MPTTPRGIRYPDPDDLVLEGPLQMQRLAEDVDALLPAVTVARAQQDTPTGFINQGAWSLPNPGCQVGFIVPASGALAVTVSATVTINSGNADDDFRLGFDLGGLVGGPAGGAYWRTRVRYTLSGNQPTAFVTGRHVLTGLPVGASDLARVIVHGTGGAYLLQSTILVENL